MVQENLALFLRHDTKNLERVCSFLSKLLFSTGIGCTLQCHIITALTCFLLDQSVATRQQRLFESVVELLLELMAKVWPFSLHSLATN